MKAIIFERYGSPLDVLKVADVEKPIPMGHEVLIKVRAAAVNPADYQLARGDVRFAFRPKYNGVGYDFAGRVEAVGNKVTRFKLGDEVFGACSRAPLTKSKASWVFDFGSFAEYTLTYEGALALKPDNLTYEQAAAVPTNAWVALQGLRNHGKIQPGQKVLISSATGGIGTLAVQIAKVFDTEVTGVCSTKNVELVKSLGADTVIDYTKEDYTKQGRRYDLIFDSVAEHSLFALRRIVNSGGKVVFVGVKLKDVKPVSLFFLTRLFLAIVLPNVVFDSTRPNAEDLVLLSDFLAAGKIKPVIAKNFNGLAEVPKAIQYLKDGHVWGKVVVTI